jgi:ATP-dependent DNA helicase RecG
VIERIRAACAEGRQAYWVCTLVEDSDVLEAEAAEGTAALLQAQLPDIRVGLVHGRMAAAEKEAVMRHFESADVDLLVATTVIEVGVNVPNASLMIIENAERLGLAQLHQLRGRVGRGETRSSCVLLYHGPLGETARSRLGILRESNDGFRIARRDLEIRGPGEVLGTRQTGALSYRIADLLRDGDLLDSVQSAAPALLRDDPEAVSELIRRWVGEGERYAQV